MPRAAPACRSRRSRADITDRRLVARVLEGATRLAEQANAAKSRFLGAASPDLRQPLQTLTLLQGLLAREVVDAEAAKLVALMEPTLAAMSGMLNTLLDINQIEAGTIKPEPVIFPVAPLLARLMEEFDYLAQAQGLILRCVPCGLSVRSDPQLLEQMLRNLLSNALKYTCRGRVLLGCRRRAGSLAIEVWDTGIGIPDKDIQAIFDEYHQLDTTAREGMKGLGLGLSIVQRLADLLGHRLRVRSTPGRGSVFAVEADLARPQPAVPTPAPAAGLGPHAPGTLLVVEDDPNVRALLIHLLRAEG
ncbi:MAG: HAMP domain-containing histidine kinase, partial [Rubritepida sp.]|nr:HAMP domain-containing histidine kinase [Rubritepida sp.]